MERFDPRTARFLMFSGVVLIMISGSMLGLLHHHLFDPSDIEEVSFDTWFNCKRDVYLSLEGSRHLLDVNGDPLGSGSRGGETGGILEWSATIPGCEGKYVSTPLLVNLDDDRELEVVAASSGDCVMAWGSDGSPFWTGPFTDEVIDYLGQTPGTSGLDFDPPNFFTSVKSFDPLDGLGPRLVFGAKDGVVCLDSNGNKLWKEGETVGNYFSTPAICDLEGEWTGDPTKIEIVGASDDEGRRSWLEAFDLYGDQLFREEAPTGGEGGLVGGAVVAQDLDGDFWDGPWKTSPEDTSETDAELMIGNHDRGLRIFVRQGEGSEGYPNYDETTSGWLGGHQTYATHAVANVTGGPDAEIFVCSSDGYPMTWTGWGGKLSVYTPGGKKLWDYSTGSERASIFSSPAIADIQGARFNPYEERLEYEVIFGCDNGRLYVMNTEYHSLLWTFDTGGRCVSSPAVCDIDNDNELEIMIGSDSGKVFCLDGDPSDGVDEGLPYPGDGTGHDVLWVYNTEEPIGFSSPVIADIDFDGMLEVVIGDREGHVYCISAGGICRMGKSEWPTFHQNNNNTGFYNPDELFFLDIHPKVMGPDELESTARQVVPGQDVAYNLTLDFNSPGEFFDRTSFDIRVVGSTVPEGWHVWVDTPPDRGDDNPDHVRLLAGESANLTVNVMVPPFINRSSIAGIVVRAFDPDDPGLSDHITLIAVLDMAPDLKVLFDHPLAPDPLDPDVMKKWISIHPGGFYDVKIIVKNTGMVNDTFLIELSDAPEDAGWSWYFLQTGGRTAEVRLPSRFMVDLYGGSTTSVLNVRAQCPLSAIAGMDIPISVRGASMSDNSTGITRNDTFHLIVTEETDLRLDIVPSRAVLPPASTLTVDLRITNLCNIDMIEVFLENETMPGGWSIRQFPEPVPVYLGQTRTVPLTIKSPVGQVAGTVAHLTMKGWVGGHTEIFDRTSMMLLIDQVHDLDSAVLVPDEISLLPGEAREYQMLVSNRGNGEEHVSFGGSVPGPGWSLKFFDSAGRPVEGTYLDPLETAEFSFRVLAAGNWPMGPEEAVLEISTVSGSDFHGLDLKVLQVHDVAVSSDDGANALEKVVSLDRVSTIRYRVTNNGNGPDTLNLCTKPSGTDITNLPGELITGIISISPVEDEGAEVEYRNFSRVLDLTGAVGRKLFLPLEGTSMMRGERSPVCGITEIDVRIPAGKSIWIEQIVSIRSRFLESPLREVGFGLGVSVPGKVDELPCTLLIRYPDLVFMSEPEILGAMGTGGYDAVKGDRITFLVSVGNIGEILAENVVVELRVDGRQVSNITLPRVVNSETDRRTVMLSWEAEAGEHSIAIMIDPVNSIVELNESLEPGQFQGNEVRIVMDVRGEDSLSLGAASIGLAVTGLIMVIALSAAVYVYLGKHQDEA